MKTVDLIKLYLELIDRYIRLKELKTEATDTLGVIANRIQELDHFLFEPKVKIVKQKIKLELPKR